MVKWKSVWAVIKGERLDAQKALNRNAVIGLFLLGSVILPVIVYGMIPSSPFTVLKFCIGGFYCYSWLVARDDEIRRNKLLVFQGILGVLLILAFAVPFIISLHAIAHPEPGAKAFKGRIGYAPGLIGGALFYFGRHISDFSQKFKMGFNKYSRTLLAIAIALEVIVIVKFIEVMTVMFASI